MNDYIKKEDAMQAKCEFLNDMIEKSTKEETLYERAYAKGWNDCNSEYYKAIKELPSIAPVNKQVIANISIDTDEVAKKVKNELTLCEDAISRAEAMKSNVRMYDSKSGCEWVPVYHLKELPSVQPNCSEKPNNCEDAISRTEAIQIVETEWINGTSLCNADKVVEKLRSAPSV